MNVNLPDSEAHDHSDLPSLGETDYIQLIKYITESNIT